MKISIIELTEIGKILVKWSAENKDYKLLYILYKEFNLGIPINCVYKLSRNIFVSIDDAINNTIKTNDKELQKILKLFRYSKWKKLESWNSYGYILNSV